MKFRRRRLPGIEIAYLNCSGRSFAKHAHDEFVIGANVVGREHIWLDGASHEAQTSEVTLFNPGQVQAGDARNNPWAFFSLYIEAGWLHSKLGLSSEIAFDKPVCADEAQAEAIRRFARAAIMDGISDDEVIEAALLILQRLAASYSVTKRPVATRKLTKQTAKVRDRLLDEMSSPPSVTSLAAFVELTPVQLVRAFTRAHGLPPHQWLNGQRLLRARHVLQSGHANLAGLALDLGFADQAHFTRRFAAIYGVTPAAYARG